MNDKKNKALAIKDKSQSSWSANCSAPARNLSKSDLGAVIFGCKHHTINECYNRLLFGLPAAHYSYVKNVTPGLPLFLFNYSDRNLYGIFEAVSPGQMNINRYGWMEDGSKDTPYPAQVRVQIQMQCQALSEAQFKPIIAENYYGYNLFYFELDRAQTRSLISLFSSSPVAGNTSLSQNTFRCRTTTTTSQAGDDMTSVSEAYVGHSDRSNMQWGSWDFPGLDSESQNLEAPVGADAAGKCEQELVNQKQNAERSFSSVVINTSASLPQKKWSSLFKTSTTFDTLKENEEDSTLASEITAPHSDHNMELVSPCDAPYPGRENQLLEAHVDESVVEKHDNELIGLKSDCKYSYASSPLTEATGSVPSATLFETLPSAGTRQEEEYPKRVESDLNLLHSDESNMGWESLATLHLDGESQPSETSTDNNSTKTYNEELVRPQQDSDCLYSSTVRKEINAGDNYSKNHAPFVMAGIHSEDRCFSEAVTVSEVKSSDTQSVIDKLIQQVEALKASQLKQIRKISSLEQERVRSNIEIQQLKSRCSALESGSFSSNWNAEEGASW